MYFSQKVWKLIIGNLELPDIKSLTYLNKWVRIEVISAAITDKQSMSLHDNVKQRLLKETKETRIDLNIPLLELIATGKHGVVYRGMISKEKRAVKVVNKEGITLEREVVGLKTANVVEIGPKLYSFNGSNVIIIEWIEGVNLIAFITGAVPKSVLWVIRELIRQCDVLDGINLVKSEMTHPGNHIIIRNNPNNDDGCDVVLIDFDRSVLFSEPCKQSRRNVSQVIQYLCTPRISSILSSRGINVDIVRTRDAARQYKLSPSRGTLIAIMNCFSFS